MNAPIDIEQKVEYLNTGNALSHVDERSYEESKIGGQSSMMGEQDFGFTFGKGLSDSLHSQMANSQGSSSPKF